jgi:NTE family protein
LWLCAVRLDDGRRVVFGRAGAPVVDVGTAVGASCAVPGLFTPVPVGGHDHVDGGAHSPTNADLAAGAGIGLVVVSSPMSLDAAALRRPSAARAVRIGHRVSLQRELVALRRAGIPFATFQPGPDDLEVIGSGRAAATDPQRRDAVARQARATTLRRLGSPELADALAPLTS